MYHEVYPVHVLIKQIVYVPPAQLFAKYDHQGTEWALYLFNAHKRVSTYTFLLKGLDVAQSEAIEVLELVIGRTLMVKRQKIFEQ